MGEKSAEGKEMFSINSKKIMEYVNGIILPNLEKQRERVVKVIKEVIGPATLNSIKDEKTLGEIFDKLYEFMPTASRLIIKKEVFINWCQKNRVYMVNMLERYITTESGGQKS